VAGSPGDAEPPRIVHVEALARGVVLHLDRNTTKEAITLLVFPIDRFPDGLPADASLTQWKGLADQWHLIVPRSVLARLGDDVRTMVMFPSLYGPDEVRRQREQDEQRRQESERWLDTYHPMLGKSPREAMKHPGWFERQGHFVWVGQDPHDFHGSIQVEPLSEVESVNVAVRSYLDRGLSLRDALRALVKADRVIIKAVATAVAGMPEIGVEMLEQLSKAEMSREERLVEIELDTDRLAVEAAIREGLARMTPRDGKNGR
jgi:hypothetical protein